MSNRKKLYGYVNSWLSVQIPEDDNAKGETELEKAMFDTKRLLLLSTLYKERSQYEKVAQILAQARDMQVIFKGYSYRKKQGCAKFGFTLRKERETVV